MVKTRTLDDVIDELGFGKAQGLVLVTAGLGWVLSGALKLSVSVVSKALAEEWRLNAFEKGSLVSVMFLGQMCGNVMGGAVADAWGRRPPVIAQVWASVAAALLSSLAPSYGWMLLCRFLLGGSCGLAAGPSSVMATEMTPATKRLELTAGYNLLFCCGMLVTVGVVWVEDPSMSDIGWRNVTRTVALPGIAFALFNQIALIESAHFLAQNQRRQEAEKTLSLFRSLNNEPTVDICEWVITSAVEAPSTRSYGLIFSRPYLLTTAGVCLSCFNLNFAYYGLNYAFVQLLPKVDLGVPAASSLLFSICGDAMGFLFGIFLGNRASRRTAMLIYLSGLVVCVGGFCFSLNEVQDDAVSAATHTGAIFAAMSAIAGCGFFTSIGFLLVYTYATEVYPTHCRASGSAFGIAFGRVGSILCPLVYEISYQHTGTYKCFFVIVCALAAANIVLVVALIMETKDRQLSDITAELKHKGCSD
jgi:putative MFS transporter